MMTKQYLHQESRFGLTLKKSTDIIHQFQKKYLILKHPFSIKLSANQEEKGMPSIHINDVCHKPTTYNTLNGER